MVYTPGYPEAPVVSELDEPYHPHDVITETVKMASVGAGAGLFLAAIRMSMTQRNYGVFGIFTRGAPIIGMCAAAPAAYTFVSRASYNLREKEDTWGAILGGFVSGGLLALPTGKMRNVLGLGTAIAITQGALVYSGGRIDSFKKESDEFERKEILRRTTRVPYTQTMDVGNPANVPGYEERRRQQIKERYNFEINPVSMSVDGSQ
ncbi:hypothetical protein E4U32_001408 [Claviceps aff. humidiphila group G2b]|nr:hypothetical protein E4U32_001408 [Claviceps aff. humidiphila group G2b]